MKTLSKKQVNCLAIMAGAAYRQCGEAMGYSSSEEFRHDMVREAAGCAGLREAEARHFSAIHNRLATMLGRPLKTENGSKVEHIAYWLRLIREALARYEFSESYAVSIAMDRLRLALPAPLDSLCLQLGSTGSKQLLFTLTNRGRAKIKAVNEKYDLPPVTEYHSEESMPPTRLSDHFHCKEITPNS